MPIIFRVTYRDQASGKILWQREMTEAAYSAWSAREKDVLEMTLTQGTDRSQRFVPDSCKSIAS